MWAYCGADQRSPGSCSIRPWSWQASIPVDVSGPDGAVRFKSAREWAVINHVLVMLAVSGQALREVSGGAHVSVGLWLDGFGEAVSHLATKSRPQQVIDGLPRAHGSFEGTLTSSAAALATSPGTSTRELLDRWLVGFDAERALDQQLRVQ